MSTLKHASTAAYLKQFQDEPSNYTAGKYLSALLRATEKDEIDDDVFLDGLGYIRDYLGGRWVTKLDRK